MKKLALVFGIVALVGCHNGNPVTSTPPQSVPPNPMRYRYGSSSVTLNGIVGNFRTDSSFQIGDGIFNYSISDAHGQWSMSNDTIETYYYCSTPIDRIMVLETLHQNG